MSNFNTPYDDSFRTLLTDCKRLVVPLVNEMFGENWAETEHVELYQNEVFITAGADKKRITDSNFTIGNSRRYHIECQSSEDGTMTVRIFEYATQVAITTAEHGTSETTFTMPVSGILYLRCSNRVPDYHRIVVNTPGGSVDYKIPIIKIRDYSLGELLEKRLFFLIPFYFFNYQMEALERDSNLIDDMKRTYQELWNDLELLVQQDKLSEFEKSAVKAMCEKVAHALSANYNNVKKGVDIVMGGKILDYEAKRIRNKAWDEAEEKSNVQAVVNMLILGNDEMKVREMYPEQFEAGKKAFEESKLVKA